MRLVLLALLLAGIGYGFTGSPLRPAALYNPHNSGIPMAAFTELYALLEASPQNLELWLKLAALETARREPGRAATAYRAALALQPGNPALKLKLAAALAQSGDTAARDEAEEIAAALVQNSAALPQHPEAQQILGSIAFARGDYAAAAKAWRPLLQLPLSNAPWYRRFAAGWGQLPVLYQ